MQPIEKRIAININSEDYIKLGAIATKKGIAKSGLLNEWIIQSLDSLDSIDMLIPLRNPVMYNFRIEINLYNLLVDLSVKNDISISDILRLIIKLNLSHEFTSVEGDGIEKLWLTGNLARIIDEYGQNIDKLNPKELYYLAQSYLEVGNYNNATCIAEKLDTIETLPDVNYTFGNAIKIDVLLYKAKVPYAESYLNNLKKPADAFQNRRLIAKYYIHKGEIAAYKENFEEAIKQYEIALDYLDIQSYPQLLTRIYIRLGRAYEHLLNIEWSLKYFQKANNIINLTNNIFYKAWNSMDLGMLNFINNDIDSAIKHVEEGKKYYEQNRSNRGLYYHYDHLGRIELSRGNINKAYDSFSKAEKYERIYRLNPSFSYSKFYKWFIEAKDNYAPSVDLTCKMASDNTTMFMPSFGKYFLNTTKYIYANKEQEADEGEQGLKQLIDESNNLIVKKAAEFTLINKRLSAVR